MTKKEIVKTISDETGSTQLKTKLVVQMVFDSIIDTLVQEGRIELRNFGVFEVKKRKARKARNPRTGEKVSVPEKFVVTFKPGKEMEEKVRELERRAHLANQQAAQSSTAGSGSTPDSSTALRSTASKDALRSADGQNPGGANPPSPQTPAHQPLGASSGYAGDKN